MLAALAEAGYSDTRARRAVVRALCAAPGRATPADLLARGRAHHAGLGQVSVYRTLDLLATLGLARRLHDDRRCAAWAAQWPAQGLAAVRSHGHNLVCERCGRVAAFDGCRIQPTARSAAAQTGWTVSRHWLELTGLCPSCHGGGRRSRQGAKGGGR